MQLARSGIAVDPRRFGRRFRNASVEQPVPSRVDNDLRLFATTFVGGFLFVSMLLA